MAQQIVTREQLVAGFRQLAKGKKRLDTYKSTTERVVREVVATLESTTAAAIAGGVVGRYGEIALPGGIPVDGALGAALAIAGLFEAAGPASHHLCSFGAGFLNGAAYRVSERFGAKLQARALERARAKQIEAQAAAAALPESKPAQPAAASSVEKQTVAA